MTYIVEFDNRQDQYEEVEFDSERNAVIFVNGIKFGYGEQFIDMYEVEE